MDAPNHVKVWAWEDAPEELRELSPHCGDEDWVALIPPKLAEAWIPWLEEGRFDASVSEHEHPELLGYKVLIAAHS